MSHPYLKSLVAQTADATVATGKAGLVSVIVHGDGTNAASLIIYDNTAASGTKVFQALLLATETVRQFFFPHPVKAEIGLFADVSGTGASYSIYYV